MWRRCFLEVQFIVSSQRVGQCRIPAAINLQCTHCPTIQISLFLSFYSTY